MRLELLLSIELYHGRIIATIERLERMHPEDRIFFPRNLVKCGISYAKVCLSVCPSVILVSHALTVQVIEICFATHDRGTILVSRDQICNTEFRACGRNDCAKPVSYTHLTLPTKRIV